MCTRLYTDVIVASTIANTYRRVSRFTDSKETARDNTYISVSRCKLCESNCKNMGVENVFTGPNGDWSDDAYEQYLQSMPQFFTKNNDMYKVNVAALLGESANNLSNLKRALRKNLLTQGTYTNRILADLNI